MIVSEIDIPSLTDEGIQLNSAFNDVQELNSSSMIEMLGSLNQFKLRTRPKIRISHKS